ncbi:nucleotidyltransferase family protein [Rubrivirga sp.]|uniref:nucleotidyltransferase family protein n=1 Tax=Rubrivirga sp. TaxID=1885344 RepID=UPI003B524A98
MAVDPLLRRKRAEILDVARRHGVRSVRVFGSHARGAARDDSDVDLLVEPGERRSFFFPGGLVADLEDLLGTRVDVVTPAGLRPLLRDAVLRDARDL